MRRSDIQRSLGLSRSTIYSLMAQGKFPRQIKVSPRAVAWKTSEVEAYLSKIQDQDYD